MPWEEVGKLLDLIPPCGRWSRRIFVIIYSFGLTLHIDWSLFLGFFFFFCMHIFFNCLSREARFLIKKKYIVRH